MLVTWTVIVLLVLITALFVAAEFAAVSVRRSRVRRLAEDGSGLAQRLLPVVEDARALDRYIAASQIGITLSSLILGAYGQARLSGTVAPWLASLGVSPETSVSTAAVFMSNSVSITGPRGQKVSKPLPRVNCTSAFCRSRAVTSFTQV